MTKDILTDTCFWLGLLSENDQHYEESHKLKSVVENQILIFPFPCFYEIVRTKFVKDKIKLDRFETFLKTLNIKYVDDTLYKDIALEKVYAFNKKPYITHSLADAVIREMISDINLRMDYFITYNEKDFADLCAKRGVEILRQ